MTPRQVSLQTVVANAGGQKFLRDNSWEGDQAVQSRGFGNATWVMESVLGYVARGLCLKDDALLFSWTIQGAKSPETWDAVGRPGTHKSNKHSKQRGLQESISTTFLSDSA